MESPRLTEYKYEGMMMVEEAFPAWALDKLKDTLFDDSDVIIATYPKCGKFYNVNLFEILIIAIYNHGKPHYSIIKFN